MIIVDKAKHSLTIASMQYRPFQDNNCAANGFLPFADRVCKKYIGTLDCSAPILGDKEVHFSLLSSFRCSPGDNYLQIGRLLCRVAWRRCIYPLLFIVVSSGVLNSHESSAAAVQSRYYAYPAQHDQYGVIAPWYSALNGQADFRVRIAAETLKRYPWTTPANAIAAYPDYLFTSLWHIDPDGTITPKAPNNWQNGDLGQRATSLLYGWVSYYRYTGDPAAIAQVTYMADFLVNDCVTPPEHPWPGIFISVPIKGKAYYTADTNGLIQLDIVGSTGVGLLQAYQLTGNKRWFETAQRWGDLLAQHCNLDPRQDPWSRYANPEAAPWKDNKMTGGVTMVLGFLDELIRLGYHGKDGRIVLARDAGQHYLREKLLPAWYVNDTWGRYFWDWVNPVQNCLTTPDAAMYLMQHPASFPNWRQDSRNILSLFLNRSGVAPDSGSDVYSGAWAFPEANQCCGRSLWYAPLNVGPAMAQYAVLAGDDWFRELAYRQMILQTYDAHATGVTEDNIDGGIIVNGEWLNIAHPLPLKWVLMAIGWLPEELGANRENHIVRSTAVVNHVEYHDGRIEYTTFDAPPETMEVLRLAFRPKEILADGKALRRQRRPNGNGYLVKSLPNGDVIVTVRHDGLRHIVITGNDPQEQISADRFERTGRWTPGAEAGSFFQNSDQRTISYWRTEAAGAALTARFTGNQLRLIGRADTYGGLADIYLDGQKQLVFLDSWNPAPRDHQVLYYRNGLSSGEHTLQIVARGTGNPYSHGTRIDIEALQYSEAEQRANFPTGTGPTQVQRMIFGYTGREDVVDTKGNFWRPATEWIVRTGRDQDSVVKNWWTTPWKSKIDHTKDPELYQYGAHGREFWVNVTVGPGTYYARLKFAATQLADSQFNCFDILLNGQTVVERFDVAATAGGADRAVDLVFNGIKPRNGIIEVRLVGAVVADHEELVRGEAFIQALEVGRGRGGRGAKPVSQPAPGRTVNLLLDPGFEGIIEGTQGGAGSKSLLGEWSCEFLGPQNCYIWQESAYVRHPETGLPNFHTGHGAVRTHSDAAGQTRIYQEVVAAADTSYSASVWVNGYDRRGKGFGTHGEDSAGLIIQEFDKQGTLLISHPKTELKTATDYRKLECHFKTTAQTATIRVVLDTLLHCRYDEGHVTYDDVVLRANLP